MVNRRGTPRPPGKPGRGFTLIELLVALALAALLLAGLVQIAAAASASTRLQRNQARLQENARFATDALSRSIQRTGFNPRPWDALFPALGIADSTKESASAAGDRLVVLDWSDRNCFENRNPVEDDDGRPRFYVRELAFDVNTANALTRQCRYGPAPDDLTTQIRRQGFINGVERLELKYATDADQDGNIDSWEDAGEWADSASVLGIRVGLLLSSPDAVVEPSASSHRVLDATVSRPGDGKLRKVTTLTAASKGRTG